MLPLWLEPLAWLVDAGGVILVVIALVATLLFSLALERGLFFHITYQRARRRLIARWVARTEHLSWSARTLREVWTRELIARLRRPLPWLRLLVACCPLLGLLGTVTGMITVFDSLALSDTSQARAMADGVARATLPTLTGMAVAVIGLLFTSRLEQVIRREEQWLHDLLAEAVEDTHA
ncbi:MULTISPECIES: MotA/TolQ/ExbB proton channel family protein [Halomonas]|uniref:MotA/TolQ/ExbB proton channel family protein n=1 Tax=Halomonas flagellata TaxID=2920385 RepID=A0ABS9RP34_9GAMM|nr:MULTISPECIES: MotA/TolQ/ExbB proton channel family protein [Halomonas]MCH4561739.1 MotA/TolQ/ExbB proton channel family protein [Halomonas flagellata]PXX99473.1 flagellar motor protein MotA [Halomonas sp. LBP4]